MNEPTGMMAAFRYRDFAIFWCGAFLTNAGGWFQSLAVPYVLFLMTGSPLWVGLAAAVQFVPIMFLSPLGGSIADRGDRRRIVVTMQIVRALTALAMFLVWFSGIRDPWILLGLAALTGCAQGVSMPSWQSLVNDLVPRRALNSAVSLNTIQFNLARSFGPAIGGLVLYAWGPSVAFLLTCLAVLAVVVALLMVKSLPKRRHVRKGRAEREEKAVNQAGGGFIEALRYIPTQPGVMTALVVVLAVGCLGMPIFQHVITFSESEFAAGGLGLTVLNLGLGLGTLIGVPVLGLLQRRMQRSTIALISMPLYGVGLVGFALSPNLYVATGFIVLIGLCFLLSLTVGNATVQTIVADRLRGRVLALNVMIYTGSVALGAAAQGWVADVAGERVTVAGAGLVLIFVTVGLSVGPRGLRIGRINDPRDQTEKPRINPVAPRAADLSSEGRIVMTTPIENRPAEAALDGKAMRQVMGSYPTGVVVVTGIPEGGRPVGMVVGTFSSVSLEPPLVSFLPMKSSNSFAALRDAKSICINILAADQEDLCRTFAGKSEDKFAAVDWRSSPSGAPILDGVVGWIECTYADVVEAGDHYIVLGAITDLALERDTLPLLFFQRGYGRFTPGSLMASDSRDFAQSVRRAECARSEIEQLAVEVGAEVSLLAPLGEEFVFVATSSEEGPSQTSLPGTRLPFIPPLGLLMVDAPGAPSEEEWLGRIPSFQPERRDEAKALLAKARQRGWSMTLRGEVGHNVLEDIVRAYSNPLRTPERERALAEIVTKMWTFHEPGALQGEEFYSVLQLSVPVRNSAGEVILVLRLGSLPEHSTVLEVKAWINRLTQSAAFIEARLASSSYSSVARATERHKNLVPLTAH